MKHKGWTFSLVFLIFVSAFFWGKPLMLGLFRIGIKTYCQTRLGHRIDFKGIQFKKNRILLESPSIKSKQEGPSFRLKAERVDLDYHVNFKERELCTHFHIIHPLLEIKKERGQLPSFPSGKGNKHTFFTLKNTISIERGKIELKEGEDLLCYEVSFQGNSEERIKGEGTLFYEDLPMLTLHYQGKEEILDTQIEFLEASLEKVYRGLYFFYPPLSHYEKPLLSGTLKGKVDLSFLPHHDPVMRGFFHVDSISAKTSDYSLSLKKGDLFFADSGVLEENPHASLFEKLLRNSMGSLEFSKGSFYCKNALGLCQLKGKIRFSKAKVDELKMGAFLMTPHHSLELSLEGVNELLRPDLDWSLQIKGEEEEASRVRFLLNPLTPSRNRLFVQIQELKGPDLNVIHESLLPFFPKMASLKIQRGSLKGGLGFIFNKGTLEECSCDSLELSHFEGECFEHPLLLKELWTNLSFKPLDPLKTIEGQMKVDLRMLLMALDLKGEVYLEKGLLKQGKLGCYHEGIESFLKWERGSPLVFEVQSSFWTLLEKAPPGIVERYRPIFKTDFKTNLKGKAFVQEDSATVLATVSLENENRDQIEAQLEWPLHKIPLIETLQPFLSIELKVDSNKPVKGSIKGDHLEVAHYVSPLVFNDSELFFNGFIDVLGTFDDQQLHLDYTYSKLQLNHPYVRIELASPLQNLIGHHTFDFKTGKHFGSLPVEKGRCLVKGVDLNFTDIEGLLRFDDTRITSDFLEGYCHHLYLCTSLDVWVKEGIQLSLSSHRAEGAFTNVKALFSHFGRTFLDYLPVEGKMSLGEKGGVIHLDKSYGQNSLGVVLQGDFKEGMDLLDHPHAHLENLELKFLYDLKNEIIDFKEVKADLSLDEENYRLALEPLHFENFKMHPVPFEIRLEEEIKNFAKMKGLFVLNRDDTLSIELEEGESYLGHFGIGKGECTFHPDFTLKEAFLEGGWQLERLEEDLPFLLKLGGSSLVQQVRQKLEKYALSGLCRVRLNYKQDTMNFFLFGEEVFLGFEEPSELLMNGFYSRGRFVLEQLKYQKLSCNGEMILEEGGYQVPYLRCYFGPELSLDLEGYYHKGKEVFESKIRSFKGHLPFFNTMMALDKPCEGDLLLRGEALVTTPFGSPKAQLFVTAEAQNLRCGDYIFSLNELESFGVDLSFQQLKVKNLKGTLLKGKEKPLNLDLDVKELSYDFFNRSLKIDSLDFIVPKISFGFFKEGLPLEKLQEDKLKGRLHLLWKNKIEDLQIALDDLHIQEGGRLWPLSAIDLGFDFNGWQAKAQSKLFDHFYELRIQSDPLHLDKGELWLYDTESPAIQNPLGISWKVGEEGLVIQKIEGELAGLLFDFTYQQDEKAPRAYTLAGIVHMDLEALQKRIPLSWQQKLAPLHLGQGYFYSGRFIVNVDHTVSLEGLLGGKNFEFLGYEFKSLSANCKYHHPKLELYDIKLHDLSGELKVEALFVDWDEVGPKLNLPRISVTNLNPSLLRKKEVPMGIHKPLVVDLFQLTDIQGYLHDVKTLTGQGRLTFHKSHKKQGLLEIPAHLISRLGLDLNLFIPTEGSIVLEVKDEKIYLNKLVDVFSNDRHCRFHLAKSTQPSYIDFQGNLNVQIKMKQYVLLKLTEPFIISVEGTLLKPRYSFKKKHLAIQFP